MRLVLLPRSRDAGCSLYRYQSMWWWQLRRKRSCYSGTSSKNTSYLAYSRATLWLDTLDSREARYVYITVDKLVGCSHEVYRSVSGGENHSTQWNSWQICYLQACSVTHTWMDTHHFTYTLSVQYIIQIQKIRAVNLCYISKAHPSPSSLVFVAKMTRSAIHQARNNSEKTLLILQHMMQADDVSSSLVFATPQDATWKKQSRRPRTICGTAYWYCSM